MTLTLKDLAHLEYMDKLEEKTLKPVIAAKKPTKTITLTEKLFTLSSRLRNKGFEKQAEELETAVLHFRQPVEEIVSLDPLYHTNEETGEDVVHQAHPDGDVEIVPAKDHQGDIEDLISAHKKTLKILIDPKKKQVVMAMLKKSLASGPMDKLEYLTRAFSSPEEVQAGSESRRKSYDDFSDIVLEIIHTVKENTKDIFENPKFNTLPLNGKRSIAGFRDTINSYLLKAHDSLALYQKYYATGDVASKSDATVAPKQLIDEALTLCQAIYDSVADGTIPKGTFDTNFANGIALRSLIIGLQHRWYAWWATYGPNANDKTRKYHSEFLTPGQISKIINPQILKLNQVKEFCHFVLENDSVKKSPDVESYLSGMDSYTGEMIAAFQKILTDTNAYVTGKTDNLGGTTNITMLTLKAFVTDPKVLSKLKFDSVETLNDSLTDLCNLLLGKIKDVITSNQLFDPTREDLLRGLDARINRIKQIK